MKKAIVFMLAGLLLLAGCGSISTITSGAGGEYQAGLNLFNQGQYEKAVNHFTRAIELDPEYGEAYLYLGRSHVNLGNWAQAIIPLRTAYRLAPPESQKEIGSILLDALMSGATGKIGQGNFQEGISLLREGMTLNPGSGQAQNQMVNALLGYGGELLNRGQASEAIPLFQEAMGYNPGGVDAYIGMARAFLMNGEWLKAKDMAAQAMSINPQAAGLPELLQQILMGRR